MKLLDIVHPAAKILVDIAKSQDSEVGDGTTTVVLLAAEFLREAKPFIEDGVHPQNLIRSFRTASYLAVEKVKELAVSIEGKSLEEKKSLLSKCAETTLSSKLIGGEKEFFASIVVDSVIAIGDDDRLSMIGIKKVPGGTMRDSFLVNGVAFKKTFSYAGFEQQPKKFLSPKILLLNIELELKSEKENAEIRLIYCLIFAIWICCLFCAVVFIDFVVVGFRIHHSINRLLMRSGISFMTSWINVPRAVPKLFFRVWLSVTLPLR